jgi:hypothetical protein
MKLFKNIFKKQKPNIIKSSGKEPCLLKAHLLHENDIGVFKWDSKHNNGHLSVTNSELTIEWDANKQPSQAKFDPIWVPASTCAQLHSGEYSWDFVVEEMASAKIGIGFMLQWNIGPDWGFLGYLGSSSSAWSYDPSTGDIVYATESIQGGLPTFEDGHTGVVSVELHLPRHAEGMAKFIVNGKDAPIIKLPESSVVLPAACFLKKTQKITLAKFKRL